MGLSQTVLMTESCFLYPLPKKSESDFMAVISKQLDNGL